MSEYDESAINYSRPSHQSSQPFTSWHPANVRVEYSKISKQQFFLENNSKNVENIQSLTTDAVFRELCPCWKPALQGTISIFDNQS